MVSNVGNMSSSNDPLKINNNSGADSADKTKASGTAQVNSEEELQDVAIDESATENDAAKQVRESVENANTQYEKQIEECMQKIIEMEEKIDELNEQKRQLSYNLRGLDADQKESTIQQMSDIDNQILKTYDSIAMVLFSITDIENAISNNITKGNEALDEINSLLNNNGGTGYDFSGNTDGTVDTSAGGSALGNKMVQIASSYVGKVNSDAEGNRLFSGGSAHAWCADFVTYITKAASKALGVSAPSGFGSASVSTLKSWAEKNNKFVNTARMSSSQRAQYIASSVKPGDIIIQKENNSSHTGVVVKVYPDGSYDTVEGNTSDSVKRRSYGPNDNKLTGFIKLS